MNDDSLNLELKPYLTAEEKAWLWRRNQLLLQFGGRVVCPRTPGGVPLVVLDGGQAPEWSRRPTRKIPDWLPPAAAQLLRNGGRAPAEDSGS